jgi:hypothetical protein
VVLGSETWFWISKSFWIPLYVIVPYQVHWKHWPVKHKNIWFKILLYSFICYLFSMGKLEIKELCRVTIDIGTIWLRIRLVLPCASIGLQPQVIFWRAIRDPWSLVSWRIERKLWPYKGVFLTDWLTARSY